MQKTDKKKWRILYPLFFILSVAIIVFNLSYHPSPAAQVKVRTYQVPGGWGYRILIKSKVYIEQPFIPTYKGRRAFPDKQSALKAGNLVKSKLLNHELPALKKEDIEKLGLDSL